MVCIEEENTKSTLQQKTQNLHFIRNQEINNAVENYDNAIRDKPLFF